MDSCYLCVLSGTQQMAAAPAAREGFGTCQACQVHACALHGYREAWTFRCADCLAQRKSQLVIQQPPLVTGTVPTSQLDRVLLDRHPGSFPALVPRIAASAYQLFQGADWERMHQAILALLDQLHEGNLDPGNLAQALFGLDPLQLARAFGLYGDGDVVPILPVLDLDTYALTMREAVLLTVDREQLRPLDGIEYLVNLAIWALAIAYAARQAESLDEHPFNIRGGALLPPLLLFLAVAYQEAGNAANV